MTSAPTIAECTEGRGSQATILFFHADSPFGEQTGQEAEQSPQGPDNEVRITGNAEARWILGE